MIVVIEEFISCEIFVDEMHHNYLTFFLIGADDNCKLNPSGTSASGLISQEPWLLHKVEVSLKYNKPRCLVCINVTERNTFTSTVTSKT